MAPAKDPMRNNRGQVLIEGILVLPILTLAFSLLLYLAYHGLCYFHASYRLEEALICMTDSRQKTLCERELRQGLLSTLLFREKVQIQLQSSSNRITGRIEIALAQKLRIEKNLLLPLEKNL